MFRFMAVALVVGGSMPAGAWARARGGTATEEIHSSRWTDTKPVAPPSGLPLAGEEGMDVDGYPTQYVDRPALRSLLLNRQFKALTAAFERFQAEFERDPHREVWMRDAAEAVGMPHPRERRLIEAWVKATPRSFAPYLARARYGFETGFLYRGGALASETSEAEFAAMQRAFAASARDAQKAIALRPRLIEARVVLMKSAVARGARTEAQAWLDDALRRCPACYEIRAEWAGWALLPMWGGSIDQIERFAARRAHAGERHHRLLSGFADFARAEAAQGTASLEAIDRACALGDDWRFLRERAAIKRQLGDAKGRLADLERANAIRPGIPWVVFGRAWALADGDRWEESGRDLLYVLRSEPTSTLGAWLHPRIVQGLDTLAWKANREGRRADAVRLYALVQALAPGDEEIAHRAEAARAARPGRAETRGAGTPTVGDARPELRVVIVDDAGRPVPGATVILQEGRANWERLFRAVRTGAVAGKSDPAGRVDIPVDVGPWTLLVFAPDGRAGVALSVAVEATGADVPVSLPARLRTEGKLLASGGPGAGIDLWAIPETDGLGAEARAFGVTRSQPDSSFAFEGLDPGRYRIFAEGKGYKGPRESPTLGRATTGGERGILIQLQRRHVLRGRILLAGGTGPARVPERFRVRGLSRNELETPAHDGRFTIEHDQPGSAMIVGLEVEGRPPVFRKLDLTGDDVDAGDWVIGEGRRIVGTVMDPAGRAVANADILIDTGERIAQTSPAGRFEAIVQEGPFRVTVRHPRWLSTKREIGADEHVVQVQLAAGATMKLTAIQPDGVPLIGVNLIAVREGLPTSCFTDSSGRCAISGLAPGEYMLAAVPSDADPNRPGLATVNVQVQANSVQEINLRWSRKPATVVVNVLDPQGNPSQGGIAYLVPGAPAAPTPLTPSGAPVGPYHVAPFRNELSGLAPGSYRVVAIGAWGPKECATASISLQEGERKELTLRLRTGDGSCR